MNTYLEIGEKIFKGIPACKAPYWGSLLLAEIKGFPLNEPQEISELRNLINSNNWGKAEEQFSKIRQLTLNNANKKRELYLLLAEKIAKITYNETDTIAQFDSNSGYWIYQLALELAQSADKRENTNRIEGILNLFDSEKHDINYFAIQTSDSFKNLSTRIFESKEKEYLQLRLELPANCTYEQIRLTNPNANMYNRDDMCADGAFKFQFDIEFEESKIGYYALVWNTDLQVIDDFYVLK